MEVSLPDIHRLWSEASADLEAAGAQDCEELQLSNDEAAAMQRQQLRTFSKARRLQHRVLVSVPAALSGCGVDDKSLPCHVALSSAGVVRHGVVLCLQLLFKKHKFRQTPFEWVYDGLSPVLIHDVLKSRKGLCIVLATIYVVVAAPLGLQLAMARVPEPAHAESLAGEAVVAPHSIQGRSQSTDAC